MDKRISFRPIIFGTVVAINLMLLALVIGKKSVIIQEAVPSLAPASKQAITISYEMEKIGSRKVPAVSDTGKGYWIVEHYRQFECHYDRKNGHLLYKSPTNNDTYLRYWQPAK